MTSSGSIKASITSDASLTMGEDRTLRWVVKDGAGADITDFSGWEFGWYLLPTQSTPRTSGDVIITKTTSSGITSSVPNVDVALDPADTLTAVHAGTYFYELWRTDTDDVIRLAYGPITFVD